jgi:amino acid permease
MLWTKIKYHASLGLIIIGVLIILTEFLQMLMGEPIQPDRFWSYRLFTIFLFFYFIGDYCKWRKDYKRQIQCQKIKDFLNNKEDLDIEVLDVVIIDETTSKMNIIVPEDDEEKLKEELDK